MLDFSVKYKNFGFLQPVSLQNGFCFNKISHTLRAGIANKEKVTRIMNLRKGKKEIIRNAS